MKTATLIALFVGLAFSSSSIANHFAFRDIASDVGINAINHSGGIEKKDLILETTGNGAVVFDYDGDGWNDVFIPDGISSSGDSAPSHLYRNDGHGHFRDVAVQAGITATGWAQGACTGDIDNDGHPDLFVTYFGHNILYRNLGNGQFADSTAKAGLPTQGSRWGTGCAMFDFDRDGKLDIFVSNYVALDPANTPKPGSSDSCKWKELAVMCGPRGLPLGKNVLYHNNGDGTFTDVSESAGILKPGGRYSLGVITADFNNDGWPDVYVACDMTPSLLFLNNHDGTFREDGVASGVAYNFDGRLQAGMGVAVADFDRNGFLDIAKTNFSGDLISLYRSEDGRFFTDSAQEAGLNSRQLLGWGTAFLDVDDDGWLDLITVNGHVYPEVERKGSDGLPLVGDHYLQKSLLFHNLGNAKFRDVTEEAGSDFAQPRPGRGLAVGDLDGDGRPEIVIVNMNQKPSVLKNLTPRRNWLRITFTGTISNRSAVGARVTVFVKGEKPQMQELVGGGSYMSQNESALYFGLGDAKEVDRLAIRWPNGREEIRQHVQSNQSLHLIEGRN